MTVVPCLPGRAHQLLNVVLCVVIFAFIWMYFRRYVAAFPITIESIWQISLAEVNRRKNIRRIQRIEPVADEETGMGEKRAIVRHMASVVGYREEPVLFKKCLDSYHNSPGLEIMLVGIDGDHEDDMEMVRIAEEVCAYQLLPSIMVANHTSGLPGHNDNPYRRTIWSTCSPTGTNLC
jgi:hyaluronan synthase